MDKLLVNNQQLAELAVLNATGNPLLQIQPVKDGPEGAQQWVVNADLRTDCGPGQTWAHYAEWLAGLSNA